MCKCAAEFTKSKIKERINVIKTTTVHNQTIIALMFLLQFKIVGICTESRSDFLNFIEQSKWSNDLRECKYHRQEFPCTLGVHFDYLDTRESTSTTAPHLPWHPPKMLTAGKVRWKQETAVEKLFVPVEF